nr:hypothetical protein [Bacteroidales bacterium]
MDTRKSSTAAPLYDRGLMKRSKRIFRLLTYVGMLLMLFSLGVQQSYGQGVGISEASIVPHASAILELKYTSGSFKGLLIPRMTTADRISITTDAAAAGLIVYDTDTNSFWYWDGFWVSMAATQFGTANQLLGINAAGDANEYKTLLGTLNQINVDLLTAGQITLSTPQDIHIGAEPEFLGLTLSGLNASSGVYTDINKKLTSLPPSSGTIGYWKRLGTLLSTANPNDDVLIDGDLEVDGLTELDQTQINTDDGDLDVTGANQVNLDNTLGLQVANATDLNGALDVAGDASLDEDVVLGDAADDEITANGNLNALDGLDVTGLLQADDNVILGSDATDALVVNATADFNDNVNVAGTTTLNDNTTIAGASTLTTGTGQVTFGGNVDANAGLDVTGDVVNLNASSDNATNINTGTSTGDVTLGNSGNDVILPKFNSSGVVHNDVSGVLSSSLIVSVDIQNETILSEDIFNGTIATIDIADDAITKEKINADVA